MRADAVAAIEDLLEHVESPDGVGAGERLLALDRHLRAVLVEEVHPVAKLFDVMEEDVLVHIVEPAAFHMGHGGQVDRLRVGDVGRRGGGRRIAVERVDGIGGRRV